MVSRSLEKMILIAIGLSTVVIVGVPVLMYSIDTINTTSQLQEVQLMAELIHNATRDVDTGVSNSTSADVWVNPGFSVTATAKTLTVLFSKNGGSTRTWQGTYIHDISIDNPISTHTSKVLYSMEVVLVDDVLHISFYQTPI
ncbi:MAG: hypothetical protein PVJ05_02950 [Candidatus Thorarchaeota archaeon]|jgi:hypothetical protein